MCILQSKQRAALPSVRGQTSGSECMYYKIHTVLNYKLKNNASSKKETKMAVGGTTYR